MQIKHYRLRDDLRIDLDHLHKLISKGDLVVVIHYFGYLTETGALREIVTNVGGVLFEDCAHALFAPAKDADVALWSYNKFLPMVDGAVLKSRRRDINVTDTNKDRQYMMPKAVNSYHQHLDLNSRILKTKDVKQALDLEKESQWAYEEYYKCINSDYSICQWSPESKCILDDTDLVEIKTIRSHNTLSYYRQVPSFFNFRAINPIAPFAYCIVVKPPLICEEVYEAILHAGVMPSRLIDKWDHVPRGDPRFLNEHTFMDQHLLLPVDESVTYNDIKRVSTVLKKLAPDAS